MKKILEKIFFIIIIFIISYMYFGIKNSVLAVGVSVSSSSVTEGEQTTITVSIPSGYAGYDGSISFDSSKISYVTSSTGNLVGGVIKVADVNTKLEQVDNFSVTFKGENAGSSNISVNLKLCDSDGNATSASGSGTITVNAQQQATATTTEQTTSSSQSSSENNNSQSVQEKQPNFKEVNEKVYATQSMNVRESWSTSSKKIGGLSAGQEVTRTGIGDNGWSRITYNGKTAYVSTQLITTTKPEEPEEVEETNTEEETEENQEQTNELTDEQIYEKIVSEIGTIPEVGTNINIYLYIVFIIVSGIFVIFILKK